MSRFENGRYVARIAIKASDIRGAQGLRARCFGLDTDLDCDAYDRHCTHVIILDRRNDTIVCTYRMRDLIGSTVSNSYSAQFYDLTRLQAFEGRMLEIGRFCIDRNVRGWDVLRIAWARIAAYVDEHDVKFLFGCTSFAGVEGALYRDVFAMLQTQHLAPKRWAPRAKVPCIFRYADQDSHEPDVKMVRVQLPALLRAYLKMGGWVSDHAVIDHEMDTLHVFTGVEIESIPYARAQFLRGVRPNTVRGPIVWPRN